MSKIVDKDRRQRDIKFIHAAARELGMDRDAYEAMLFSITLQRSCSQLDYTALQRVRDHLRKCGAGSKKAGSNEWRFIDSAPANRQPLLRKICAVCRAMKVGKPYAEGVARRIRSIPEGVAVRLELLDFDTLWLVAGALERTKNAGGPGE